MDKNSTENELYMVVCQHGFGYLHGLPIANDDIWIFHRYRAEALEMPFHMAKKLCVEHNNHTPEEYTFVEKVTQISETGQELFIEMAQGESLDKFVTLHSVRVSPRLTNEPDVIFRKRIKEARRVSKLTIFGRFIEWLK
ncbi:hypothetical protein KAR91_53270 [Candidatus Pacearchaeota archaeon]|nr:hypothetical protein [Candidatus Pacearchaeota archaeon]